MCFLHVCVCAGLTWRSGWHTRRRPCGAVAAAGGDLVDVFPLQRGDNGGLPDVVGVTQTQLHDTERILV